MPLSEAKISVLDRGFLFGDAVYEVVRTYGGRPFLFDEHFARLERSLRELFIEGIDTARLRHDARELITSSGGGEATLYVQISRGAAATRTHAYPEAHRQDRELRPTELMYVSPYHDSSTELRRNGCTVITFPDVRWARCDIKSVNLLGNVLAAQAAKHAGVYEALFVMPDGTLTEGSRTNLAAVVGDTLVTLAPGAKVLPGITRDFVLTLAREAGLVVDESRGPRQAELAQVNELFLTGTTAEVMPVVQVDGKSVGNGRPGPVTRKLAEAFARNVSRQIEEKQ